MRIAVYGKGGIGKSTFSANLSAAQAAAGRRVMQIGCDPKQDSTRLLVGGQRLTTVMDYLRDTAAAKQRLREIVHQGWRGIDCVEAGGPEPGVGCAGRGILSAFAMLDRLGCDWSGYDAVVYDVLGDVVCGGFAVPLRKGFAETILVVTSEEFMSVYAANNILRGVRNMQQGQSRSVGLIVNRRQREGGIGPVRRFADKAGVPILAVIPRSEVFQRAEARAQTLQHAFGDHELAEVFRQLARKVASVPPAEPKPLSDGELERLLLGRNLPAVAEVPACHDAAVSQTNAEPKPRPSNAQISGRRYLSKSLAFREPLHGCAFTGAVNTLTQIRDATVVAHGPRSCAHIAASTMLSSGLASLRRHGQRIPEQLSADLISTEMTDATMVHGGLDIFRRRLQSVLARKPKATFVVTTCPAGVIGDDVDQVIAETSPRDEVHRVSTDGDIEGDYLQGVINACIEGAGPLIDPAAQPTDDCVNIVAEKNIATNAEANFAEIERLLATIGLRVHCRFVRRTTAQSLRTYLRAPLNLPAYLDHLGRVLRDYLTDSFGCKFARHPFPSGFHETEEWIEDIGEFFGRQARVASALEAMQDEYRGELEALRPHLAGKCLMLVTYNHDVDWILETAFDLDMEVVKVGIVNYSQDGQFRTRYADRLTAEVGYNPNRRADDIADIKPDLVLGNYQSPGLPETTHYDTVPLCPNAGHLGGLALAQRWRHILAAPMREGWRRDEARLLRPLSGGRAVKP
ncbi:MAG: nitrogen fixation protein NifH [Planctomycetes bacterium]|jgi:nitrogenase iron protein|nr:nitrogen fixation protein NifH [Planctomycetota bacterium]